jgi:hypothetical protein
MHAGQQWLANQKEQKVLQVYALDIYKRKGHCSSPKGWLYVMYDLHKNLKIKEKFQ